MSPDTPPGWREAFVTWLRVALLSFGGPAGQIAVMHRIIVDEKRWIDEARFLHGLNFCMLLPGPEAQQLATWLGWRLHGTRGAFLAGGLFILPGALLMLGLSALYALYGALGPVAALFFGLKAAVLAIVVQALFRVAKRALKRPAQWAVAGLAFLALFAFGLPFPLVIVAAALAGAWLPALRQAAPTTETHEAANPARDRSALRAGLGMLVLWLVPVAWLTLGWPGSTFTQIAALFSQLAAVSFGGAYAVLALVAQEAAGPLGWLTPPEMLDGLGLAETTPGPLILVLQFVGFLAAFRDPGSLPPLLAGTMGAGLTLWATFAPCFAFILLGAPFIERLRQAARLASALAAVTAAVVGVIANLGLWFALHTLFARVGTMEAGPLRMALPEWGSLDPAALALAVAALVATFALRWGMAQVLAAAALAGLGLHMMMG